MHELLKRFGAKAKTGQNMIRAVLRNKFVKLIGIGFVAIVSLALAWIKSQLFVFTWLGLICFFLIAAQSKNGWDAALRGFLIGFLALGIAFSWAPRTIVMFFDISLGIAWVIFILLLISDGMIFVMASMVFWCITRGKTALGFWIMPLTMVIIDSFWPRPVPWNFASSQVDFIWLAQVVEFTGQYGITFCLTAVCAECALYLCRERTRATRPRHPSASMCLIPVIMLALVICLGVVKLESLRINDSQSIQRITVGVIQVDPSHVEALHEIRRKSLEIMRYATVICWPECSLGSYRLDLTDLSKGAEARAKALPPFDPERPTRGINTFIISGGASFRIGAAEDGPFYQTAFLISPDERIIGRYFKRTLMPFGEYIPGENLFPAIRDYLGLYEKYVPGDSAAPLVLPDGTRIGILMCYEDMVAKDARETVREGAQVLVSLVNGSSFQGTLPLEQHLQLSRLRAVETRRYLVRCSATGVTCIIDPLGRVVQRLDCNVEDVLVGTVALRDDETFYVRYGDWFPWTCAIVLVISVGFSGVKRLIRSTGRAPFWRNKGQDRVSLGNTHDAATQMQTSDAVK